MESNHFLLDYIAWLHILNNSYSLFSKRKLQRNIFFPICMIKLF